MSKTNNNDVHIEVTRDGDMDCINVTKHHDSFGSSRLLSFYPSSQKYILTLDDGTVVEYNHKDVNKLNILKKGKKYLETVEKGKYYSSAIVMSYDMSWCGVSEVDDFYWDHK